MIYVENNNTDLYINFAIEEYLFNKFVEENI